MNDTKLDDTMMEHSAPPAPQEARPGGKPEKKKRGPVRRVLRWTAFGMAGLLGLVAASAGGGLLFLRSDMGERWLTDTVNSSLGSLPSGMSGHIAAFKGPLLSEAHVEGLVLKDRKGEWLRAKSANLRIDWSALPSAFVISEISLDRPVLLRVPETEPSPEPAASPEPSASPQEALGKLDDFLKNWPEYLPALRVDELALRSAEVTKDVSPLPFVATVMASASASREGLTAGLSLLREDGPLPADALNRRAELKSSLTPGLRFKFDADLSDLGFASAFVPADLAVSPAVSLALKGDGPIADWKMSLDGALSDSALSAENAANVMASLAGRLGLRPLEKSPEAEVSLKAKTGGLSPRLWTLAGQKDGRLSLELDARAAAGDETSASTKLEIGLADMQWGTPLLDALLGKEVSAGTSASVKFAGGALDAELDKLYAKAEHISADAAGSLKLDGKGLYASGSRTELEASVALNDAAALSPELSGDVKAQASVSGPFTALKTELGLTGSRLDTASVNLKDIDVRLGIPSADIARIAEALSGNAVSKASKALMEGALKASAQANGYPVDMAANWAVKGAGKAGLDIKLEELDLRAGSNKVLGQIEAKLDPSAPAPAKGSIAAMAGSALPSLDGSLSIDISDWAMLKEFSGLSMAGEPLKSELVLTGKGRQGMEFRAEMPSFQLDASGRKLDLSGLRIDMEASDIWGRPAVDLLAGFKELKADRIVQGETELWAEGGLDAVKVALESKGGVESSVKAEWKPGSVHVEKLDAKFLPENLGLPKGPEAGLSLTSPVTASYSGDAVELSRFTADILPAGQLSLEGRFSPSQLKGQLALTGLDLKNYRHFSQKLPSGLLAMQADFSGTPQVPSGNFKLNLKDISMPGSGVKPIDADLIGSLGKEGRRRMLQASLVLPEKSLKALSLDRFALKANVPFTSPASGTAMPDMKAPFSAEFSLGGQVAGLWKLVPAADMKLSGMLDAESHVGGTLSSPVVTAHVSLDKGRFFDILNGVGLDRIQLKLDAEQFDIMKKKAKDKVTFSMSGRAGSKGTLELGGWLDPATMVLDINGSMKELAPLRRQDAKVMLSGTLGVKGTVDSPIVKADITVDKGQVELAKLPGSSIPELEIWTPEKEEAKKEKPASPGRLDVTVRIPNQFFVRGYGLDCEWGGMLRIDSPLNQPAVGGRLKAVRGSLDILGKTFKLAEGEVRFDGGWPVSPLLNIDMEYVASNLTANILVSGTASRPKLTLTSQPAYAQDEIISQIMFGQSSGSLSHVQAIQLASSVATLTGFGGGGVMDIGRKVLGVDVFRVNSDNDGEQSDVSTTSLEVGTYVRDNIYVGMEQGVGKDAETGAVVQIELLPSLEVQAKAGSKDTEVGLEWKKNY